MRLLHAADLHLGLARHGHVTASGTNSRIEDFTATLNRLVDDALGLGVAAVVLAGDTFNSRREGPQERNALATALRRLTETGIRVVIVPGNHDGMSTIGDASTHSLLWLQSLNIPGVSVLTRPGLTLTDTPAGPVGCVAIPYPHKRLFEGLLPDYEVDLRMLEAGKRMDDLVRGLLPAHPASDVPIVLVGHFTTFAASLGSEQTMKATWDVSVSPDAFAGYDYVALGHIHRQQQVAPNAWYAGSPEYIDFGEDGPKGWLVVEVEHGQPPVVKPRASGARLLRTIALTAETVRAFKPEALFAVIEPVEGDIVRLVYDTPERPRAATIAAFREGALRAGASDVKSQWKAPASVPRARVTVDPTSDRTDLLRVWLESKGLPIEPTLSAGRDLIASLTD